MRRFDDDKDAKAKTVDQPDEQDENESSGLLFRFALITGVAAIAFVLLIVVVTTSGSGHNGGSPRVLLVVVGGFKGTAFQSIVFDQHHAPNLRELAETGSYSECNMVSDTRCARTHSGARLTGSYSWDAAPGFASILTGVDPRKHGVYNDSKEALSAYGDNAERYPTFLKMLRDKGVRTAAVGTPPLLTSQGRTNMCDNYGVLDFECGKPNIDVCIQGDSCNTAMRRAVSPSGHSDAVSSEAVLDVVEEGAEAIVVHFNKLNEVAQTTGFYSQDSVHYVNRAYITDAFVGQVVAGIEKRIEETHENWLVVVTSDHGGRNHSSGDNYNDDEVVPFVVSTITSGGPLTLKAPKIPTRQIDVAPTILSWMGIDLPQSMEGTTQGICGTGSKPVNCVNPY